MVFARDLGDLVFFDGMSAQGPPTLWLTRVLLVFCLIFFDGMSARVAVTLCFSSMLWPRVTGDLVCRPDGNTSIVISERLCGM